MHLAFLHQFVQMAIGQAFIIYCIERCRMSQSSDCLLIHREVVLNICWLKLWLAACICLETADSFPRRLMALVLVAQEMFKHRYFMGAAGCSVASTQPNSALHLWAFRKGGQDISMRCFLAFPIDVWWLLWPIPLTVSSLLWRESYLCPKDLP